MSNLVWIGRTSIWVRRPALKNRGRCWESSNISKEVLQGGPDFFSSIEVYF